MMFTLLCSLSYLVLQDILVMALKYARGWDGTVYYGIIYCSSQLTVVTNSSAWCHKMSWHQRLQEVSLYQFILVS